MNLDGSRCFFCARVNEDFAALLLRPTCCVFCLLVHVFRTYEYHGTRYIVQEVSSWDAKNIFANCYEENRQDSPAQDSNLFRTIHVLSSFTKSSKRKVIEYLYYFVKKCVRGAASAHNSVFALKSPKPLVYIYI